MSLIVIAKDDDKYTYGFQHEWLLDVARDGEQVEELMHSLFNRVMGEQFGTEQQGESDATESIEQPSGELGEGTSEPDSPEVPEDTDQAIPDGGSEKLDLS